MATDSILISAGLLLGSRASLKPPAWVSPLIRGLLLELRGEFLSSRLESGRLAPECDVPG